VPDLGYWITAESKRGRLPSKYQGVEGRRRLHIELDACIYYGDGASPAICRAEGVKGGSEEKGDKLIERFECDGHVLEKHRRWLPDSFCHAITKYPVTDASQLAIVREMFSRRRYAPNPKANEPAKALNGHGQPITAVPRSPLPALMADWVGVEGTVFMMADAREEVEKTLEVIDRANDGLFSLLSNVESKILHFCDNLSADTIGGYWDRYCAGYYKRRVKQVHEAGKYCVTHLDGATKALIPRLMAAGLDGIESLTPKPVGDITMEEMSQLMEPYDGVFWGGLPGAMFAPPFRWEDLKMMIDGLHRLYRGGRRVVVASADLVPPDGKMEDVRRVAEYLKELGA
jgi:hypothetical protein